MFFQTYFTRLLKQNTIMKMCILLTTILVINGCASLSKGECREGDWDKIGQKDGAKGYVAKTELTKHQSACSKYKITPNNKIYYNGYAQGLKRYCRREIGFEQGESGSKYLGTCPASLAPTFLSGYIPGLEVAMDHLQSDIDDLRYKRRKVDRRLDSLYHSDENKTKHKDKDRSKNKDNKKYKKRIKNLEERLDDIQSEISSKRSTRDKLRSWYSRWSF